MLWHFELGVVKGIGVALSGVYAMEEYHSSLIAHQLEESLGTNEDKEQSDQLVGSRHLHGCEQ